MRPVFLIIFTLFWPNGAAAETVPAPANSAQCARNLQGEYEALWPQWDRQFQERLLRAVDIVELRKDWLEDPAGGPEKLALAEELGLHFRDGDTLPAVPTFSGFLQRYMAALERRGVPQAARVLPAMVLYKDEGENRRYHFITPGIDPWPEEEGFIPYNPSDDLAFNLPTEVVNDQLLRQGRFPMLPTPHDPVHFLSILAHPAYWAYFLERARAHPPITKQAQLCFFALLEYISWVSPQHKGAIQAFARFPGVKAGEHRPVEEYIRFYEELPEQQVMVQAELIGDFARPWLVDYGAGPFRPLEKWMVISLPRRDDTPFAIITGERATMAPSDMVSKLENLDARVHMIGWLRKARLRLEHSLLRKTLEAKFGGSEDQDFDSMALRGIREQLARVEYGLWTAATVLPIERVIDDMMTDAPDPASPTALFWRDVLGEGSALYQSMQSQTVPSEGSR